MFTILNLLNYAVGKPVNVFILITITIVVYFYLIKYYWDTIYNSYVYTSILLILLILDIITIVLVFFYDRKIDDSSAIMNSDLKESNIVSIVNEESPLNNPNNVNGENGENGEKGEKKKKKDKSKKNKNADTKEENKEKSYILDNKEKELISLFDINADPSLITY